MWFEASHARHNEKETRKSRKVGTGYEKYVGSINGQAVAEQIVVSLGNEEAFANFGYMKSRPEWRDL